MTFKVIHVSAVAFTLEKLIRPLLELQRQDGHDVSVITNLDHADASALDPFKPVHVAFPRSLKPQAMWRAASAAASQIRDERPDIVHLHTPAAAMALRLLPRSAFGAAHVVYTVHGFAHLWPPQTLRDKLVQRVEAAQARRTDSMLFVSKEDLLAATSLGYQSNLHYVGNGVSQEWFQTPRSRRRDSANLRIVYVGRLVREKGVLELTQATLSTSGIALTIVGEALASDRDSIQPELDALLDEDSSGKVRSVGMRSPSEVREILSRSDFGVLPSYREGLPMSVIEQMAAGLPCIVTNIRGSRELITDGVNGLVCAPRSVEALSQTLEAAAKMTNSDYVRMSEAAYSDARENYTLEGVHERITAVYNALTDGR